MAAKFVVLFACISLAAAGMVRRDAPSAIEDLNKHAAEFQKTFNEGLNSIVNSQNTQETNKALKEGSDAILKQLSEFSKSIESAIADANGKTKDTLEKTKADIQKATEDLRKAHPEVEQNAEKVRQELQKAVNSALTGTQSYAKELASNIEATSKKLSPQVKAAYDDLVKQAQEVQKNFREAVNKKQ